MKPKKTRRQFLEDLSRTGVAIAGTTAASSIATEAMSEWLGLNQAEASPLKPSPMVPHTARLYTWGNGNVGGLANGSTTNRSWPNHVPSSWTIVAGGQNDPMNNTAAGVMADGTSFGIRSDGSLWAWGNNSDGELGLGATTPAKVSSPVQVSGSLSWVSVSGGLRYAAGVTTTGRLYTWGFNAYGQLGQGNTTSLSTPTQVGALTTWQKVACAGATTAGIHTNGNLFTWGLNNYGEIGDGTRGSSNKKSSPVQIAGSWKDISGGDEHFVAIQTDGSLWAWGYGGNGQIGNGAASTNNMTPVKIGALSWVQCAAGMYNSYAIRTDGTLWAWGSGQFGALGPNNPTLADVTSPIQIAGSWSMIAAGTFDVTYTASAIKTTAAGIRSDGTLWVWGYGEFGQTGNGTATITNSSPIQVPGKWSYVSVGPGWVLGIRS